MDWNSAPGRLLSLGAILTPLGAGVGWAQTAKSPLFLGKGEQRLLVLPGMARYSLGSKIVRGARPPGLPVDSLLLKGVRTGKTDLWVWKRDGESEFRSIYVRSWKRFSLSLNLMKGLSRLRQVEVIPLGKRVILRGVFTNIAEASLIASLARIHRKDVIDETTPGPELLNAAIEKLQTWAGARHLRLQVAGKWAHLYGSPPLPPGLEQAARQIYPFTRVQAAPISPILFLRVFLMELERDEFESLGFQWPNAVAFNYQLSPRAHEPIALQFALQAIARRGRSQILANPELTIRVPGEAELFSGGQIPVRNQSRHYSHVVWKNHGLSLKVKALKWVHPKVELNIETQVSSLQMNPSENEPPPLRTNRMRTEVQATLGRPLLLCGLIQTQTAHETQGLPLLSRIPLIGKLFGRDGYQKKNQELVAIVLPHSQPPPNPEQRLGQFLPKGPIPVPRNWVAPEEMERLRESPDFPWNVLE